MTARVTKLQNRTSGLPAEDHRLITTLGSPGANLHGRAGYLPGPTGFTGAVTLLSNTQLTVDPGRWIIPGTQSIAQGDYPVANDAQVTLSINAQQAGLSRVDLVCVRVRDTAYTPNEGQNDAVISIIPGTPAATGAVAPATPVNSLVLGALTVPPPGSPVTFTAALLDASVGLGGIRPARAADTTPGRYVGEHRDHPTYGLERWDGGRWTTPSPLGRWTDLTRLADHTHTVPLTGTPTAIPFTTTSLLVPDGRFLELDLYFPLATIGNGTNLFIRILVNGGAVVGGAWSTGSTGAVGMPVRLTDGALGNGTSFSVTCQAWATTGSATLSSYAGISAPWVLRYRIT